MQGVLKKHAARDEHNYIPTRAYMQVNRQRMPCITIRTCNLNGPTTVIMAELRG